MPVRRVGPLTTRGAFIRGLRALSNAWTASNSAASMIGGTAISTTSTLRSRVFRQHLVHGIDAPASAVARSEAGFVQMIGNRFDAH
jgi:hypothetical protein